MKSMQEIRNELIQIGVTQRLLELNQERDILLKLINSKNEKEKVIIAHVEKEKKKKKHWMQLPKNRARMLKQIRKMQKLSIKTRKVKI